MNTSRYTSMGAAYALILATALALSLAAPALHAAVVAKAVVNAPVTLTDNGATWTLDNGLVKATINKSNSNLRSLVYHGIPIVARSEYWEQTPSGRVKASVTIDPARNGGERGEVDVTGINGRMDIEVRYAMERGVSGFYTYAQYSHKAGYPPAGEGESRFILQMNPTFDWLTTDADRNMPMIANQDERYGVMIHAKEQRILTTGIYKNSVEHKYSYCGVIYKLPAYGWSSIKDHVGVYFINPSTEYIGGGAEKLDLVCHMGATLLDYWTSGHYGGGAGCNVAAGQNWTKVIGPIFVYFNALAEPEVPSQADLETFKATSGNPIVPPAWTDNATALWHDALDQARVQRAKWPFDWVNGVDYPHKADRGNVSGQLVLDDPQAATTKLPHLTIGLAHPDYVSARSGGFVARSGNGNVVTWAHDGDYYQFWTDGDEDGNFKITNVRPGTYTLHAFADGVLGEFARTDVTVKVGEDLDLHQLDWKPVRYGRQIWEIGYPDRTADKFYKGDGANYWLWGWCLRYADLFPHDVTYTIGQSDYHKDWFFEEVPHAINDDWKNPAAKDPLNQRFGWVNNPRGTENMWDAWGRGRATTWTVKFNMDKATHGNATLRVALAGSDATADGLEIGVNGRSVGSIPIISTNALRYNTDRGVWRQYALSFDAALLKAGANDVTFTVPAGECTSGVVWDYLRMELNDGSTPMPPPLPAVR